ncbi:MAG TPA: cinnamycin family lantibiotic [Ktedonobacteraceae bacterium]|jgi:hypothetical protein
MLATIERSLDREQLLYQAAVDNDFRAELLNNTSVFGMDHYTLFLPDSVEQQDQASLKFWTESIAAGEVYACASTCSYGPITAVCDGTTK